MYQVPHVSKFESYVLGAKFLGSVTILKKAHSVEAVFYTVTVVSSQYNQNTCIYVTVLICRALLWNYAGQTTKCDRVVCIVETCLTYVQNVLV